MYLLDRRVVRNFDWILLLITLAIMAVGIVNLYSSTYADVSLRQVYLYEKQITWIIAGLVAMILVFAVDYRRYLEFAYVLYALSVGMLILVLFFGKVIGGSQRWLILSPVSFQPSEFVKVTLILALARYFHKRTRAGGYTLRELFVPFLMTGIPVVLTFLQPDFGTALLLLFLFSSMILFIGIHSRSLFTLSGLGLGAIPVGWFFLLKEYQRARIRSFLDPSLDPLGTGYHALQSKVAVGSGGMWGKGFLEGSQTQLHFLPEQHTDFVFSVLAEEWGFLGAIVVLILFFLLFWWGIKISRMARDKFGMLISLGVVFMIFWAFFTNIGMVIGIMPVVGIPLPILSYGGSSMVTTMMGIGLLMNVSVRRYVF